MSKITAIIPTFNEEIHIDDAIQSVQFADEIIIIDSFSTDNTVKIAKKHNVVLIQRIFDDYSSQKNFAIDKATHNWICILDADERISIALKKEILKKVSSEETNESAFWIYRSNIFMNKEIKYSGWQNDKVIRLFKKDSCRYNGQLVHEEIYTKEKIGFLKNKIVHNTYKSFDIFISKKNDYATLQALELNKKNIKPNLYHFILKPIIRFNRHYFFRGGVFDGVPGLVISYVAMYTVFIRYLKLWLLIKKMK